MILRILEVSNSLTLWFWKYWRYEVYLRILRYRKNSKIYSDILHEFVNEILEFSGILGISMKHDDQEDSGIELWALTDNSILTVGVYGTTFPWSSSLSINHH